MGFFDTNPAQSSQWSQGTSTANPWAPAAPVLTNLSTSLGGINTGVTGQQSQAGQDLWSAARALPNMMPSATGAVQNIFGSAGMIPTAYGQMQTNLSPIAGMSANPYQTPGFSDALSTLTNNITNTVKGQYAGSGRSPSGAGSFAGSLGRGLMQGEAPILQDQYNKNLANIMSANQMLGSGAIGASGGMSANMLSALQGAGMLPSLGMAPASAEWNAANQIYGQPIQNINQVLAPAATLGGMGGTTSQQGFQTGTQTPASSGISNVLGGISGGLGLLGSLLPFSDRRLKTDVKDIGRTHDNQKIYSYRFKGSSVPQIGMMADEIEKKTPEAVETDAASGYKRVRYDRATRKAATMGMLQAA